MIALQLALDFPDVVHTLALMEPARPIPPTKEQEEFIRDFVAPAVERYRAGTRPAPSPRSREESSNPPLERRLPAVFAQAVADADAFFAQELPALQSWSFTQEDASRIRQPALAIRGENTAPTFPERIELLLSWLPNAEEFVLPSATHLLHLEDPRGMADGLAAFFARHPLAASRTLLP